MFVLKNVCFSRDFVCVCAEFMLNCVCVSAGIVGVLVLKNV